MKRHAAFWLMASTAVAVGFAVGFGIGKETREAADSNVTTDYSGGVVTIKADVGSALKAGVSSWAKSL